MTVKAATMEPSALASLRLYVNTRRYTEAQAGKILTETGGDFCIGGPIFLWDKTTSHPKLPKAPCCHLKADGAVLCAPPYVVPEGGPAWDKPADYGVSAPLPCGKANYIQCVPLIRDGKAITPLTVNADMAYPCARMVIGGKQGRVAYYVSTDRQTPLELQALLLAAGWDWAEMLDGGGSACYVNKDGGAIRCDPGRVLYSYLVFPLAPATAPAPTDNDRKRSAVLDTARAEIGVKELPAGSNRVKYNDWYYGASAYSASAAWCMVFVGWVFAHSGLPLPVSTASCTTLANYAKVHGQWVTSGFKPGDIAFMHWHRSVTATEHVGIVESVHSTYVTTIEGNTSLTSQDNGGAVMRRNRALGCITGAYRPWYNIAA
jgi:CHAP domain.